MALRLAEVRANLKGSPEVLVVTYNRVLVAYMNALKSFDHGITVDTFHHVCMEYLKGKGLELDHAILGQADREKRIDFIVSENRERYPEGEAFQMPSSVFAKEIEFLEQFGQFEGSLAGACTGCLVSLFKLCCCVFLEILNFRIDLFNKFFHIFCL